MENNPLHTLTEKLKQQNIENRLQVVEANIKLLKEVKSMKLIELEVVKESGPYTIKKTISLNPECVSYVEAKDDSHCYIHIGNSELQVLKSREEVMALISGDSGQTYVK